MKPTQAFSIQTPAFQESANRGAAPCRPATPPKKLDTRMRQSISREKRKKWAAVHQSREVAKEGRRSINPEKQQKRAPDAIRRPCFIFSGEPGQNL
ncbi:hypothetical protein [Pseudoxanthomonas winnipegensis]|uniref:hypothetical protein n=1 Tax=Pseudoxanthomonas winnipegensis TaxID=2480810 RepID=UPI0030F44ADF